MSGMFKNEYPYTDFHELNLSWLIRQIVELTKTMSDFVSLNTIKYADPIRWDITTQYEMNTIVVEPNSGTAYISTKPVPSGVDITNTDYWTVIFDLGPIIDQINQAFTVHDEGASATASDNWDMGTWLWINDMLYIATQDISVGSAYIPDGNIRLISVEEMTKSIYYPNDKKLSIHANISDYSEIVTRGDFHIYRPLTEAIEIRHVD